MDKFDCRDTDLWCLRQCADEYMKARRLHMQSTDKEIHQHINMQTRWKACSLYTVQIDRLRLESFLRMVADGFHRYTEHWPDFPRQLFLGRLKNSSKESLWSHNLQEYLWISLYPIHKFMTGIKTVHALPNSFRSSPSSTVSAADMTTVLISHWYNTMNFLHVNNISCSCFFASQILAKYIALYQISAQLAAFPPSDWDFDSRYRKMLPR